MKKLLIIPMIVIFLISLVYADDVPFLENFEDENFETTPNNESFTFTGVTNRSIQFNANYSKVVRHSVDNAIRTSTYLNLTRFPDILSTNYSEFSVLVLQNATIYAPRDLVIGGHVNDVAQVGFGGVGAYTVMHSALVWFSECNGSWVNTNQAWSLNVWYNVTFQINETSNRYNVLIDGSPLEKMQGCSFNGGQPTVNYWGVSVPTGTLGDYIYYDQFIINQPPIPFIEPVLNVEWDSLTPLDDSFETADITFNYNLTGSEGFTNCSLYTNQTGSFTINQTSFNLGNNTFNFNYSTSDISTADEKYYVSCSEDNDTVITSTKTLHIDNVNVFINVLEPQNNTNLHEDQDQINFSVSYFNVNLDTVNYTLYRPSGVIHQSNVSTVGASTFLYDILVDMPVAREGTWTIEAWGNDSIGSETFVTTTFDVLSINITVDMTGQTPLNNSLIEDELTQDINFDLQFTAIDSVDCNLFRDDSLRNSQSFSSTGVVSLQDTYTNLIDETYIYKINCTYNDHVGNSDIKTVNVVNDIRVFGFATILKTLFIFVGLVFVLRSLFNLSKS